MASLLKNLSLLLRVPNFTENSVRPHLFVTPIHYFNEIRGKDRKIMPDQTQNFRSRCSPSIFTKALPRLTELHFAGTSRCRAYRQRRYCLLQEVMGAHEVHPLHVENWPDPRTTSFSPTLCGAILPTVAIRIPGRASRQRRTVALSH